MSKLLSLEDIVFESLSNDQRTRGNDYELVLKVYESTLPDINHYSFRELMLNYKEFGLPPFESITRCRRKLQKKYTNLLPEDKILEIREKEREEYVEYSKIK